MSTSSIQYSAVPLPHVCILSDMSRAVPWCLRYATHLRHAAADVAHVLELVGVLNQ